MLIEFDESMVFNSWKFSPILSHHTLLWQQNSFKFLLRVVNRQLKQGWDEEPLIENYFESFLTNFYMCRQETKRWFFFSYSEVFSVTDCNLNGAQILVELLCRKMSLRISALHLFSDTFHLFLPSVTFKNIKNDNKKNGFFVPTK